MEIISISALVLVYLSHLGYLPLDIESDEARRALVTSEMMISGDFITPTINGQPYLNKPPLYNYILAGYFKLFGNYSMFAFRLQCIVAILVTGALIYYVCRRYVGHTVAFFTALAYLTNGRLLLYESLYGMIDPTFSLVVYGSFLLVFYFGEKQQYKNLFLFSYVACALGFLLKGLPAIAFQGLTLLTWFGLQREWKKLFSWEHFYGILGFLMILAPYYLAYFASNDVTIQTLMQTIFGESEKRTFIEYDAATVFNHLLSFPGEIFYHFLPWTIFLVALIGAGTAKKIRQNNFIKYLVFVFLANIIVYWVSPDVYPKYLFMFVPLIYMVAFYFYFKVLKHDAWQKKMIDTILTIATVLLLFASIALPFTPVVNVTEEPYLKAGFLIASLAVCSYMTIRNRYRLYFFVIALLLGRQGFNWFVIEQRGDRFFTAQSVATDIARKTNGKPLYILQNSDTRNFDGMSFEIATLRNEVLKASPKIIPGAYYITDSAAAHMNQLSIDLSFENLPDHNKLYLAHANLKEDSLPQRIAAKK